MFTLISYVALFIWIKEHPIIAAAILVGIILLIAVPIHRRRARQRAYLALPVRFIGNNATKTFHYPHCSQLDKIAPGNKVAFRLPNETAGYKPCGICNPFWPKQ